MNADLVKALYCVYPIVEWNSLMMMSVSPRCYQGAKALTDQITSPHLRHRAIFAIVIPNQSGGGGSPRGT